MIILGISGGFDPTYANYYDFRYSYGHDTAAVLIENGKVVAGIEGERLNRIKHTNKCWTEAVRFCLEKAQIGIEQIDAIAYYRDEEELNRFFRMRYLNNAHIVDSCQARYIVSNTFKKELGYDVDMRKLYFVPHHLSHASAAYFHSGFEECLVFTIDGQGDGVSSMVLSAEGSELKVLKSYTDSDSLGFLYLDIIRFLGYELFDEYKVMGLAPYGVPEKYRDYFQQFYELLPNGRYKLFLDKTPSLYSVLNPRRTGEPFQQIHKDIAAALQETLEVIVLHALQYYQTQTNHKNLCMAGGVALNCAMNRAIHKARLFQSIFVHPAAHDGGGAIGAALHVQKQLFPNVGVSPLQNLYWGTGIGSSDVIEKKLKSWGRFFSFSKKSNICKVSAELIARDEIIGWVQGCSEFGPRALGNRSILGNPNNRNNIDIINRKIKKREGYRPFAPSVLKERVNDFFDVSSDAIDYSYMTFLVDVKEAKRKMLGAITHVDGTARIQTVSKHNNIRYWKLLRELEKHTGVPIVLNTSFNNHVEPIVDSINDAISCFLSTDLEHLIIGSYLITKKSITYHAYLELIVSLPLYAELYKKTRHISYKERETIYLVKGNYSHGSEKQISLQTYCVLEGAVGNQKLQHLCDLNNLNKNSRKRVVNEILELFSMRLVELST